MCVPLCACCREQCKGYVTPTVRVLCACCLPCVCVLCACCRWLQCEYKTKFAQMMKNHMQAWHGTGSAH